MRDWRREDAVYAVLTALASSLILYLVAGNLGLVSSPTTIGGSSPPGAIAVAVAEGSTPGPASQTSPPDTAPASPDQLTPDPGEGGVPPEPSPSPTPSPGGGVGGLVEQLGDLVGL
jgi:hypothetical protein